MSKINNSYLPGNNATAIALNVVTAWLAMTPSAVISLTDNTALLDLLSQRLVLTPNLQDLPFEDHVKNIFSMFITHPLEKDLAVVERRLHHPNLRQVVLLHPTWIGRILLPEWHLDTHICEPKSIRITNTLAKHGQWQQEVYKIGNLRSLLWGFLSGRMHALGRPDLMDCCSARMRCYLFPTKCRTNLTYLRISRWVKKQANT